ncbi:MAG TPA: excinuclease ABC subunit UvrC [Sulfurihydrogenibium sp.]|uniref:excinuclease ABC subunit UvrC n=1 Tax=Sulfurihydrogenibium sp. (strain YO3AOP1) TaxID=436114 RepID=UPI00017240E9|nr:excinuclease ABC subunit UvrC [Sulfurihydrogenibium sp. YO3AOP1]ACD65735.1 excinuclease ABC, C subunit [Sulfurihydrogenibium sp. YO3AOP1]HBT99196.1 excinuclease ABC subunit UvrC [Sulfurihydrogenibium sp.]
MNKNFNWALEFINKAPEEPGVYLFKDSKKQYVYIGKAVNIKNRLKNHYQQLKVDPKERKIFKESSSIEWIITKSDYEAFVLENELIKQYKPKYNVRLKSGSSYPMLVITDEEYPTVKISRKFGEIKGEYFGPFLPARTARAMKELIHKLFKLRTCDPLPKRSLVCFDYHLGLCSGPCADKISMKEYKEDAKVAKAFLSGNVKNVIYELYDKVNDYTNKLMFEKAAVIRDQIKAIEMTIKKQEVIGVGVEEADIFYFSRSRAYLIIVRGNRIVGKDELKVQNEEFEEGNETAIITDYYSKDTYIPKTIITNKDLEDLENLKQWLLKAKNKEVEILTFLPEQVEGFIKRNINIENIENLKSEFEKVFGFSLPNRVECFDISHLDGKFTVGSCVVWENGSMNKKEYRRFRVRTVNYIDDFASLREVLTRRFRRYKEMDNPPELVLIDGGKGQLSQGLAVRQELGLENLRVFSIAKKEEIIYTDDGKEVRLFENQELLKFFTKIRDEAHRFAITYNRKLREKEGLKSVLDNIEGIGEKRKEILYRTYKTLDNILKASDEELKKLGIPTSVSQKIKEYLKL